MKTIKLVLLLVSLMCADMLSALEIKKSNRFGQSLMEVRLRSFNNTGSNEIYAGVSPVGSAGNRTELNYIWTTDNWLEINYDSVSDLLRVTLLDGNGSVLDNLDYPNWEMNMNSTVGSEFSINNLTALQISLINRELNGELSFEDVELDGIPIGGDFDIPAGQNQPNTTKWLFNDYCFKDFNLYGRVVRNGTFSNSQENSKIEFKVGTDNPINEIIFNNGFEFCY